ncbi:protein WVD2-like 2 [Bidens hawaiensis]|uniref:protein WVD2-like 2 n=1 Tax=Bidens hawaiensis TaxID=980011 RepID=UPI004048FB0D
MGRDTSSVNIRKSGKVNGVSGGTNPRPSGESVNVRKSYEKQDAVGVKTTKQDAEAVSLKGKTPKPEPSKSLSSPVSPVASGPEKVKSPNANSPMNAKQLQNSPYSTPPRAQRSSPHDEEDNWSLASSAATSRTVKSRVTVGVAPSFRSAQRAEQRKEFYTKLEQKQQALKAEKMEYEARTKEEQEEAIKQLRKTMVVKANPVPSFYRQGPPPKVELKKLPLTRAKSPNLTRRKSCGDTTHGKALCSKVRHSLDSYKPTSATSSPVSKPKVRITKSKPETNPNVAVQS